MNSPTVPFSPTARIEGPIGGILIDAGRMTQADAERVLAHQRQHGTRFGESARKLGLITDADIDFALARQYRYPVAVPGTATLSRELVCAWQPHSARAERFRQLRGQLVLRWFDGDPARRALAISSAAVGDGRSHVVANLAVALAQLGRSTLLIDADMRRPRQHQLFDVPNGTGLSQWLNGRCERPPIEQVAQIDKLAVLPCGPLPPNPQELLASPEFGATIDGCAKMFDFILLDTPALNACGDGLIVARRCGGALVVGRRNRSRIADLTTAVGWLREAGVMPVGTVLNGA